MDLNTYISNWIFRFALIQLYYFRHGCPSFNEKETAAHSHHHHPIHQHRNNIIPLAPLGTMMTDRIHCATLLSSRLSSTWLISSSQHSSVLRISIAQVCRRHRQLYSPFFHCWLAGLALLQSVSGELWMVAVGYRSLSELWRMRSVIHYWHWKTDDEMIKRLNWYARWFFLGLVRTSADGDQLNSTQVDPHTPFSFRSRLRMSLCSRMLISDSSGLAQVTINSCH